MTPESLRVKLWREANRERYNENQRTLMKNRRAKKKANETGAPVEIIEHTRTLPGQIGLVGTEEGIKVTTIYPDKPNPTLEIA